MQRNFTQDDILLYIYNEITPEDKVLLETELQSNTALLNYYLETRQTLLALDEIIEEPSETIIQILNEEARSSSLEIH